MDIQGHAYRQDSGAPTIIPPTRAPARSVAPGPTNTAGATAVVRTQPAPVITRVGPDPGAPLITGAVRFTLQVTGSADLTDVSAALDGQAVAPNRQANSPRDWLVTFMTEVPPGTHQVNVQARDRAGQSSSLAWQFEAEEVAPAAETPQPAASSVAVAVATPLPPLATPIPAPSQPAAPPAQATAVRAPAAAQAAQAAPAEPTATPLPKRKAKPTKTKR